MRVLKDIAHPIYKVSIFMSGEKYIVRYVDRGIAIDLTVQEGVASNIDDVEKWASAGITEEISAQFTALRRLRDRAAIAVTQKDDKDDFPVII